MFKSQLETLNLNPPIERETPVNKSVTPTGGAQAWPEVVMPTRHDLFYDGHWQEAKSGRTIEIYSPGTQESLGHIADASSEDVDAAVRAAHRAFPAWRKLAPQERVAMVKQTAHCCVTAQANLACWTQSIAAIRCAA